MRAKLHQGAPPLLDVASIALAHRSPLPLADEYRCSLARHSGPRRHQFGPGNRTGSCHSGAELLVSGPLVPAPSPATVCFYRPLDTIAQREPPSMILPRRLSELLGDPHFLRLWLIGLFSMGSRWLEMLVVGIFAVETTGSPVLVALLVILRMLPLAVFGSVVGTFADRLAPRFLLYLALAVASLVSLTVLGLALSGIAAYWHIALATFLSGVVWTTDMPVRRRLIGDIAGPERIAAGMSLDSATSNAMRLIGPLFGGLLYQWLGLGGAFGLAAGLYALCLILTPGVPRGISRLRCRPTLCKAPGRFRRRLPLPGTRARDPPHSLCHGDLQHLGLPLRCDDPGYRHGEARPERCRHRRPCCAGRRRRLRRCAADRRLRRAPGMVPATLLLRGPPAIPRSPSSSAG